MNLYQVLHVAQDAPDEIIKLAYKGLAQKYHPDRYKGDDANEIMVKIREAYETLIDPNKRKKYDQFLAEQARCKQQQEEYLKKKEQDDFIRNQKAAFEKQNKNSFDNQTNDTDSKSFKMNISIDVPNSFSIFSPFIKLKKWLKSKKKLFIQVGTTCIALALIVTVVIAIDSYMYSVQSAEDAKIITEEALAAAEASAQEVIEEAEITADGENTIAAQQAISAAIEPGAATDETESFNKEIYSEEAYRGPQDERLVIRSQDITNTTNLVFRTFKENGMIGVNKLVSDCYVQNLGSIECVRLDFAGKYLNDSGIAAGLPEYEYFKGEAVLERIYQNFYSYFEYDGDIADGHALELMHKIYASMELEII